MRSTLVEVVKLSPNHSGARTYKITKFTPHHAAGKISVENLLSVFLPVSRQSSCNYAIGDDGRIGLGVEETNRAWTSSSALNDQQAITVEVSNSTGSPDWLVSEVAWKSLVALAVDCCRRNPGIVRENGKSGLYFDGTPRASLTLHEMYAATLCPGPHLKSKMLQLCKEVNAILDGANPVEEEMIVVGIIYPAIPFMYNVLSDALAIHSKPNPPANELVTKAIRDKGSYTIVERDGTWGRLKSGAGWVSLNYGRFNNGVNVITPPPVTVAPAPVLKATDKVKLVAGARYFTGGVVPQWVQNDTWVVSDIQAGGRVVVNKNLSGKAAINSPFRAVDLIKVG